MSSVAWIIFGLIPGFLTVALAAHKRETVRVESGNSKPLPMSPAVQYQYCLRSDSPWSIKLLTGGNGEENVENGKE